MADNQPEMPKSILVNTRTQCEGPPTGDMMDYFHPCDSSAEIPATSPKRRVDYFDEYRPLQGVYADYHLSQTDIKMIGRTKIHWRETRAEYEGLPQDLPEPPSDKMKKMVYFNGRPPCWEFWDEIRARKIEKKQAIAREEAKERQRIKAILKKKAARDSHNYLMSLVGPDWYQEISYAQMRAVETLSHCIQVDLKHGTVYNVGEAITTLGILPRPTRLQLSSALMYCCDCPVEFLLILYQLINPNRKSYSLNDRLLLSAVVHLTMTHTLRELHCRIPSPPRSRKEKPKKKEKPPPKIKEKPVSPYLEPFSFQPKPRRHGIYKNSFRQYPESQYFTYIDDLRAQQEDYMDALADILVPDDEGEGAYVPDRPLTAEEDLIVEWSRAKESFERLNIEADPMPTLHRANVYPKCKPKRGKGQEEEEVEPEPEEEEEEEEEKADISLAIELKVTSEYDETKTLVKQRYEYFVDIDETLLPIYKDYVEHAQNVIAMQEKTFHLGGVAIGKDFKPYYIVNGVIPESHYDERIEEAQTKLTESPTTLMLGGVCISRVSGDPVYLVTGVVLSCCWRCRIMLGVQEEMAKRMDEAAWGEMEKKMEEHAELVELKELEMLAMEEEKLEGEDLDREMERRMRKIKPTTPGVMTIKPRNKYETSCLCKKAVALFLKQPRCHCHKCMRDLKEKKKVFIIDGTVVDVGEAINIITGVTEEHECRCLERYLEKIKGFEERKRRQEAYADIKSIGKKFVIQGVTRGPDGKPIYILANPVPEPKTCECVEENRREQLRMKNKPPTPPQDKRYLISGVQATPTGNVFVVTGVQPFPPCDCMQIYSDFVQTHKPCMDLYEAYLKKVKKDMDEYMAEIMEIEKNAEPICLDDGETPEAHAEEHVEEHIPEEKTPDECFSVHPDTSYLEPPCPKTSAYCPMVVPLDSTQSIELGDDLEIDDHQEIILELELKKKKRVCICDPDKPMKTDDCICKTRKVKRPPPPPVEYRRYIFLKSIPCDWKIGREYVRQALKTMQEDGFPLAKLPDSYLLPHFKLWWKWRCGFYIPMEERSRYFRFSMKCWRHTTKCDHPRIRAPVLDMSLEEAESYTWAHSKTVKKLANDFQYEFFRKVKQGHVERGREFFPTICDYDLPTKPFRDVYFAYMPPREIESFARRPWCRHEFKDMRGAKICK